MTEASHEGLEPEALRIQRRFDAKPAQMYRYLTEAEHLARWFGPKNIECRNVSVDARAGEAYRIEMINPDGSEIVLVGEYLELEAPSLIRMTWRWLRDDADKPGEETLVTIRLTPAGFGTLLQLTHERFGEASERDRHDSGWTSSFDCLDDLVAGKNKGN